MDRSTDPTTRAASAHRARSLPGGRPRPVATEDDAVVAAATAGDERAFATLVRRHERELHVHCYRMLGSFEEAQDLVQETFVKAWTKRHTFDGTAFRAWLYRIATNASLDAIRARNRRVPSRRSPSEVPWLTPYPDRLLDEVAPRDHEPDAVVVARESIELAFLTTIQLLPARQRAVLILRDVLGWSAKETASLLETTVASANSALQRARATLAEHGPGTGGGGGSRREPTADERAVLARFMASHESFDPDEFIALLRDDVRVTMPPQPLCYDGPEAMRPLFARAEGMGRWRLLPTSLNRQPAAASYLLQPGDTTYRAFKLDVLRVHDGAIAEITTFGPSSFPDLGLPDELPVAG